jgi:hypothetical protein
MEPKTISINENTLVVVKSSGDLNLQGWDKLEIQPLADDRNALNIVQEGDAIRIQSSSDLDLTVPAVTPVTVDRASGDAYIRNLNGVLQIQRVGGDLHVQNAAILSVQGIGGDCELLQVSGALTIQRVGGDFVGAELAGPVKLEGTGGDVRLQVAGGEVQIRAGGDLELTLQSTSGQNIRLHAGGDALLNLPPNAGVTLDLRSRGHDIAIEYGGQSQDLEKRFYQVSFGDGQTQISIDAGGDIRVTDDVDEIEGFDDLVDEVDEHWNEVEESRSERSQEAEEAFSFRAEEMSNRINRKVEEAMRQADSRLQEAMKKMEQRTRRMERGGFVPPVPPVPPMPPFSGRRGAVEKKAGVSDEERRLVLKMLEEKKITVEEAARLLEALEG